MDTESSKISYAIVPMWIISILMALMLLGYAVFSFSYAKSYNVDSSSGFVLIALAFIQIGGAYVIHKGLKNCKRWAYYLTLVSFIFLSLGVINILFTGFGLYGLLVKETRKDFGFLN
ncbi:hypothetical protein [Psychromonas sp.]|uniref:hypothetical protein n=1 Tax=Psychromonas sp. TaxID=1884585 RepID=UPI0039E522BD